MRGDLNGQLDECREATRLAPNDSRAHDSLGVALAEKGNLDDAVAEFQQAVRLDPGNLRAQYNCARSLARKGKVKEAAEHLAIAVQGNSQYGKKARNDSSFKAVRDDPEFTKILGNPPRKGLFEE
jgi:Flp pilus assembly protein TadD